MAVRPGQITSILNAVLGSEVMTRCPDAGVLISETLRRYRRTGDTLGQLFHALDSSIFNMVYTATGRTMMVSMDDGTRRRVTTDELRDLSDRLLSLTYANLPATPSLQGELFDLALEDGSFAAMRELVRRFPLDEDERKCVLRLLQDNGELE